MAKKKVVVSFDFEHDKNYYYMLKAWDNNPNIKFSISDCTPREIQTESISVIKQVLSRKINEANYMIAIIGAYSITRHPDAKEIGYNNWQSYEIDKNAQYDNGLVVVKLRYDYTIPKECSNTNRIQICNSFNEQNIISALNKLAK